MRWKCSPSACACREPALVYLRFAELVWPVTLFPAQGVYHAPRPLTEAPESSWCASARWPSSCRRCARPPGEGDRAPRPTTATTPSRAGAVALALRPARALAQRDRRRRPIACCATRRSTICRCLARWRRRRTAAARGGLAQADRRLARHEPGARRAAAQRALPRRQPDGLAQWSRRPARAAQEPVRPPSSGGYAGRSPEGRRLLPAHAGRLWAGQAARCSAAEVSSRRLPVHLPTVFARAMRGELLYTTHCIAAITQQQMHWRDKRLPPTGQPVGPGAALAGRGRGTKAPEG